MVTDAPGDAALLHGQLRDGWPSLACGIMLAGAAYPIMVFSGYAGIRIVNGLVAKWDGVSIAALPRWIEVVQILMLFAMTAIFAGILGLLWTGLITLATLPCVYLVVWSLKLRGSIIWLGAFCGGLIAFIAVVPFMLNLPISSPDGPLWVAIAIVVGPGLATIFGQLGGMWGGVFATRRARWYDRAIATASVYGPDAARQAAARNETDAGPPAKLRFQFGIRHLMWTAAWLSVLLSVIRLSRVPFAYVVPMLFGWLIYQSATLWLGWYLARRLGLGQAHHRESRST
jgi:hypothetical protein